MRYKRSDRERLRAFSSKSVFNVIIVLGVIAMAFVGVGLLKEELIAASTQISYEEVKESAIRDDRKAVNFSVVHSAGSTATSWLYIPGTQVDYPLVQGADNDFYLDRDAYGNDSTAGAIFINFANSSDMSDAKTVIFGHNMADGSMFTDLHNYSSKEFGSVHQDAYIYMESGEIKHYKLLYYIFTEPLEPAVYVVSKADTPDIVNSELKDIAAIKYRDFTGNELICLSTCTMHTRRTVVVFEYVDANSPVVGSKQYAEHVGDYPTEK